jgi:REP element-mobilizing transposase RayT
MARLPRMDRPDRAFHVMNRGIARRVVFPDRLHIRAFLACLALAVRRGDLEILAFCILPTHFHLLVRSPTGRLSAALGRAINAYVRWYNRRAGRDGPLFRGRFTSRIVLSIRYRRVLLRYIEHNPVQARIVDAVGAYPYSSAYYWGAVRPPRWLASGWLEEVLEDARRRDPSATYARLCGDALTPADRALVEERLRHPSCPADDLDDLVGAAPDRVLERMLRNARRADGGVVQPVLVDPASVADAIAHARRSVGTWARRTRRGPSRDLWPVAAMGLLHDLAGQTLRECATRQEIVPSTAAELLSLHRRFLEEPSYAVRMAELGAACLRRAHPDAEKDIHPGSACPE